jgi:glycosyltransferase involved in cell wall biosynthesis
MMPELFFQRELEGRKHVYNEIITAKSKVLFSSNAALNDFKRFYPNATNSFFVINFAVTHPEFQQLNFNDLQKKYSINKKYFIIPNQFWVHKNHQVVLDAALILKNSGIDFHLIFTGKESDFRAPEYTIKLKEFVQQNMLTQFITFLGFIPREDQLCLMKNSVSIIQPSLFEGWSTVVEDAKAINHWIILSDIAVHQEQIKNNVSFFNPKKAEELALQMQNHLEKCFSVQEIKYNQNIENFGKGFLNILKA